MPSFSHPLSSSQVVEWDDLPDDEARASIVDAFYTALHDKQAVLGDMFDRDQYLATIPQVVQNWKKEREASKDASHQWFRHPLTNVKMDWVKLRDAHRMAVAILFIQENKVEQMDDFIADWVSQRKRKIQQDLDADLVLFTERPEGQEEHSLDVYRTAVKDLAVRAHVKSRQARRLFEQMLDRPEDGHYKRRELYDLLVDGTSAWTQCQANWTLLVQKQAAIEGEFNRRHLLSVAAINKRHQEEKQAFDEAWRKANDDITAEFEANTPPIQKLHEDAIQDRYRTMKLIHEARQLSTLANIGVNLWSGSELDSGGLGSFHLDDEEVQYIQKQIFPLLCKTGKVFNPAKKGKTDVAGEFLKKYAHPNSIHRLDISELNLVLDQYNIAKPSYYRQHLEWRGNGLDNFSDFYTELKIDSRKRYERYTQEQIMQQYQRASMQQILQEAQPPNPTTTSGENAEGQTTSSSSSSSSSLSSAPEPPGGSKAEA